MSTVRQGFGALGRTLAAVGLVHAAMLVFDIATGFSAFLRGDRSETRLATMESVARQEGGSLVAAMAHGAVAPGEYVVQLPFYLAAGPLGVVVFQIALMLASVAAMWKIVERTIPHRRAPLIVSVLYALTPMTLTFSHQLTTEALATPLCVLFTYFAVKGADSRRLTDAVLAGLCLGAVVLIRPGYMVIIPCLFGLGVLAILLKSLTSLKGLAVACVIACLPLAGWTALFAQTTGAVGYTGGVANVGWNLRSKVFFVERAHGRAGPVEVARFKIYDEMWSEEEAGGKISLGRYLAIAAEHPVDYVKAGAADLGLAFGRGGLSKLAVDYFGVARDKGIKEWRNVLDAGGPGALVGWAFDNLDILAVTALELAASLVSVAAFLIAVAFMLAALARHRTIAAQSGQAAITLILVATALIATTALSALVVDRAQPRLRNPADPAILLLGAMAVAALATMRKGGAKSASRDDQHAGDDHQDAADPQRA